MCEQLKSMMGGQHFHADLIFQDGMKRRALPFYSLWFIIIALYPRPYSAEEGCYLGILAYFKQYIIIPVFTVNLVCCMQVEHIRGGLISTPALSDISKPGPAV